MKWDHIIYNGTIATSKDIYEGNIYIKDGKIAAITTEDLGGDSRETTDAKGLYILPGLMDTHVHSRDGGAPEKEDFFHSTKAAAAGGLTTIFEMPNAVPAITNVENLNKQLENLTPKAHVDFAMWGLCLGELNNKDLSKLNEAGVIAFKFFWGYAVNSETYQLVYNYDPNATNIIPPLRDGEVYKIFEEVSKTGKLIAIHAENADLMETLTDRVKKEGDFTYEGLLRARPNLAEETIVQTAISFAKNTDTRLHILHVSAKESIDLCRRAQKEGYPVTMETCPHFLFINNEDYGKLGPKMKVYPPIKYKEDQEKLWEGIQDGIISSICSDHAPHTAKQKDGELWDIPSGMCGVETLAPLMIDAVSKGKININQLVALLSENPAKLFGIYPKKGSLQLGTDADITLVDMYKRHTIREEELHSVSKVTAFDGFEIQGMPVKTIVRGKTVMEDGKIVSEPFGEFIKGKANADNK
jgi:allantoinase